MPSYHIRAIVMPYVSRLAYLDLEQVVTTDALIVHLVISVVSVAAALVLHERESVEVLGFPCFLRTRGMIFGLVLTICCSQYAGPGYRSGRDVHSCVTLSISFAQCIISLFYRPFLEEHPRGVSKDMAPGLRSGGKVGL